MKVVRDRKFDCSKCGLCCRSLGRNPIFSELGLDPGNGICKFLDQDTNLCTIYENRPLICRVDDFYEKTDISSQFSKKEWHRLNKDICQSLIQENSRDNEDITKKIL